MLGGNVTKLVTYAFRLEGAQQTATDIATISAGAMAVFYAANQAAAALKRMADQTAGQLGQYADWAGRLDVSVQNLHALGYAAEQTDGSFESLSVGLFKMQRFIDNAATSGGQYAATLDRLGLSAADFIGLDADERFMRMSDALNGISDADARANITMEIFGRGGVDLMNTLAQGSDELHRLTAEARQFGVVMDTEAYAAADRYENTMRSVDARMQAVKQRLTVGLLPALEMASTAEANAAQNMHGLDGAAVAVLGPLGLVMRVVAASITPAQVYTQSVNDMADAFERAGAVAAALRDKAPGTAFTKNRPGMGAGFAGGATQEAAEKSVAAYYDAQKAAAADAYQAEVDAAQEAQDRIHAIREQAQDKQIQQQEETARRMAEAAEATRRQWEDIGRTIWDVMSDEASTFEDKMFNIIKRIGVKMAAEWVAAKVGGPFGGLLGGVLGGFI
jgi:hypothetical protein